MKLKDLVKKARDSGESDDNIIKLLKNNETYKAAIEDGYTPDEIFSSLDVKFTPQEQSTRDWLLDENAYIPGLSEFSDVVGAAGRGISALPRLGMQGLRAGYQGLTGDENTPVFDRLIDKVLMGDRQPQTQVGRYAERLGEGLPFGPVAAASGLAGLGAADTIRAIPEQAYGALTGPVGQVLGQENMATATDLFASLFGPGAAIKGSMKALPKAAAPKAVQAEKKGLEALKSEAEFSGVRAPIPFAEDLKLLKGEGSLSEQGESIQKALRSRRKYANKIFEEAYAPLAREAEFIEALPYKSLPRAKEIYDDLVKLPIEKYGSKEAKNRVVETMESLFQTKGNNVTQLDGLPLVSAGRLVDISKNLSSHLNYETLDTSVKNQLKTLVQALKEDAKSAMQTSDPDLAKRFTEADEAYAKFQNLWESSTARKALMQERPEEVYKVIATPKGLEDLKMILPKEDHEQLEKLAISHLLENNKIQQLINISPKLSKKGLDIAEKAFFKNNTTLKKILSKIGAVPIEMGTSVVGLPPGSGLIVHTLAKDALETMGVSGRQAFPRATAALRVLASKTAKPEVIRAAMIIIKELQED